MKLRREFSGGHPMQNVFLLLGGRHGFLQQTGAVGGDEAVHRLVKVAVEQRRREQAPALRSQMKLRRDFQAVI